MTRKLNLFFTSIKENLGLFLSISFAVFLFILFFQPFPLNKFDFNNKLLFIAGFGAIVFLFMIIVWLVYPWMVQNSPNKTRTEPIPYLSGFILLVLNAVAFAFYLYYVGLVSITFYIMFKVVFICLAPTVTLKLHDLIKELNQQNESLIKEKKNILKQVEKYEDDYLNKSIEFVSENMEENLNLLIADVAYIQSANNYVEIIFREGENFRKKLIRNTLKHIELQIKPYSNFIRCHRTCIVNTHYVEKLQRNYNNHWLTIKGVEAHIPVSRQYLLKVREIF